MHVASRSVADGSPVHGALACEKSVMKLACACAPRVAAHTPQQAKTRRSPLLSKVVVLLGLLSVVEAARKRA